MGKKNLFFTIIESSLAAVFLLASCNSSATPAATAAPTPLAPTAAFTPVPSMADTPIAGGKTATLAPTDTPTLTITEPPTPTEQLTPQINPGMNANCRKGPGTYYYAITFLQAGTNYDLIGQDGLNKWWKVQLAGNVTCWIGDPTSVMAGPVWDVPILPFPPLPGKPTAFTGVATCHSIQNSMNVALSWDKQYDVTGFHLYRNGQPLTNLDPKATTYQDNSAPLNEELHYELEAYNDYGVSARVLASFTLCG
jgi:hypothetical protein